MPISAGAEDETPEIGTEVISIREENVKHFSLGNGNYQAVAYSHPIHEEDEDGNWQDIDFSMDLTRQNGTRVYANEAGSTAFAASYKANQPIMTLGEEGNSISMTLVTDTPSTWSLFGSSVAAEVTGAEVDIQTLEDAQNANFSNTLLYEEVMPGIDLEYIVDPWCVKENIIVNQPTESYFYRFFLDMDGMYPVMQEDGSILIYSEETNEPQYEIPAPYMYDAEGEESFDVFYNIETTNGDYYLTVFADSNWINADDRVFPVTIDPSYVDDGTLSKDTYINEDAAGETRGDYNFFYVGENEVAYIHVPIPDLPVAATLEAAALRVYYYYKAKVNYGSVQITAHKVTGFNWEENALTWNSVVARDPVNFGLSTTVLGADNDNGGIVTAYGNIGAYADTPVLTAFDITNAVQDWINGNPNYGIGLRYVTTSPNRSVQFRSTEGPAVHRPTLQYTYSVPYSIENLEEVNLNLYYDNAYGNRFSDASDRIERAAKKLQEVFLVEFNIMVNYTGAASFYSYGDTCSASYSQACTCGTCENPTTISEPKQYHHTNLYNNLYRISPPTDTSTVKVAFLGHEGCECVEETCKSLSGLADKNRRVAVVSKFDSVDLEAIYFIHEFGHIFGIEDHYTNFYPPYPFENHCLYGPAFTQMLQIEDITICQGCRNIVDSFFDR